ncbi:alpha/beta hydrolase [Nocardia otitidiscaviarum]|uniref:Alpha/beta hydrolase n=1 Tax=Nocardia otitidiscaviarum TaxID=1823 RepID=A0A516NL66_9NOCA|nr:alpha/beta fold hydrolase [Nocardia otitidiscaviarum]MCP9619150.1 alpha/beta hydrolase [Nocardia otitidiscaviarum]QDP79629.1 alpha/beta hydrolase [Nocardia otitidiscaviarum]
MRSGTVRSGTLKTPGATIYHEVRGSGPLLLMIPGGGGDAGVFDAMAEVLERHFTVAALDPRGYSRSTLDSGHPERQVVAVQSDDAHRLLAHLSDEPAFVFGTSNGAIVGLDLLARHPEQVRALIAHEPPCFAVLPDAEVHRAMVDEVYALLWTEGVAAAGARFMAGIGPAMKPAPEVSELSPRAAALWERLAANAPRMIEHELREFTSYVPDYAALAGVAHRLVVAAGRETRGCLPYRPAEVIADRLGRELVEFPGAHNGTRTDAPEFAGRLIGAFTAVR